jgi:hypothetical protein
MNDMKKTSLVKPTVNTPFHIDFDWWKQHDNNWRIYLLSCLCTEHETAFHEHTDGMEIDWIDPQTAEVKTVDGLQHTLMTHCARQPGFVSNYTTMVDTVFRVLLANGNSPLSPAQMAEQTGRSADTILKLFTGIQIYKGIRPIHS